MAVYELGSFLNWQAVLVSQYVFSIGVNAQLNGNGTLQTDRDLTAQEQTNLTNQVAAIKAQNDPVAYVTTARAALKARLLAAYPVLHNQTVAQVRTAVSGQIGTWSSLANAKTDLQQWMPDLIAAVLILILNGE